MRSMVAPMIVGLTLGFTTANANSNFSVMWLCPEGSAMVIGACADEATINLTAAGCDLLPNLSRDSIMVNNEVHILFHVSSTNCLNNEITRNPRVSCPAGFSPQDLETFHDSAPFFQWQDNKRLRHDQPNRICRQNTGILMF